MTSREKWYAAFYTAWYAVWVVISIAKQDATYLMVSILPWVLLVLFWLGSLIWLWVTEALGKRK